MNNDDRVRRLAETMGVVCGTPKDAPIEYPHIIIGTHKTIYCRSRAYIFWIDLDNPSAEFAEAMMNSKAWKHYWHLYKDWLTRRWTIVDTRDGDIVAENKSISLAVLAAVEGRE